MWVGRGGRKGGVRLEDAGEVGEGVGVVAVAEGATEALGGFVAGAVAVEGEALGGVDGFGGARDDGATEPFGAEVGGIGADADLGDVGGVETDAGEGDDGAAVADGIDAAAVAGEQREREWFGLSGLVHRLDPFLPDADVGAEGGAGDVGKGDIGIGGGGEAIRGVNG